MWAKVTQVGSVGELAFVLVEFRAHQGDAPPVLVNDFLFNWPSESLELVHDEFGRRQLTSGEFVLPVVEVDGHWVKREADWARQTVTVDIPGRFRSLVAQFLADHAGWTGDMTDPNLTVSDATRQDVAALLGAEWST